MIIFLKNLTRPFRSYLRLKNKYTRLFYGKYFGLNNLDQVLETYLPQKNGFFVELGANDGITQSNTKYFELFKGWKGVLIEPYPPNAKKCLKYRKSSTQVFQAACVSSDYAEETVKLLYSNLMTIELGRNGDITDPIAHALDGKQFLQNNEYVHEFDAPAITLTQILLEAKAPQLIDLLSLDVEGNELQVLGGLDFEVFKFKYICVETRTQGLISHFLELRNYEFLAELSGHDYLYKLKDK